MKEEFRTVKKYPHLEVSNLGRVLNTKTKNFIGYTNSHGYKCVDVSGKQVRIHQLVVAEFLYHREKPSKLSLIDHINRDKTDNNINNLRIVTAKENSRNTERFTKKRNGCIYLTRCNTYQALITFAGKRHVKSFKTKEEAQNFIDKKNKELNL